MCKRILKFPSGKSAEDFCYEAVGEILPEIAEMSSLLPYVATILHSSYNLDRPEIFQEIEIEDTSEDACMTDFANNFPQHLTIWHGQVQASQALCDAVKAIEEAAVIAEKENEEIEELGIDIETFSSISLPDCGVYKYVESPDFTILLFYYSVNNGPVQGVDLASGETIPEAIMDALYNPDVLKTAFNAAFERTCLSKYFGKPIPVEQWDCTMVLSARHGFPLSLAGVGEVLGLEQKKMKEGAALIKYFSCPCKATKKNGGRTRNLPSDDPEKWAVFKRYCKRDVEVEQAIRAKLVWMPVPEWEKQLWFIDQHINDRGVLIDREFVQAAKDMDDEHRERLMEEAKEITGLENPNSGTQLRGWLSAQIGCPVPSLNKEVIPDLMKKAGGDALRMLNIRKELGKTSTKKYTTMLECACEDDRIHGLLQFCGATRTGRWAGRLVQLQNLPQNHLPDLERARNIVKSGDLDELDMAFGNVPSTLSELIRTALIAKPGCLFHVCDFSAIEARVIAWLAGEEWVLEVFRNGGDIYCSTASKMFGVPVERHGQNSYLRPKGKVAVLGLGYQGGVNALKAMGGEKLGLTDEEMTDIVKKWRANNPHIVRLWSHVEQAAKSVIQTGYPATIERGVKFERRKGGLCITLPSGRMLYYPRAGLLDDGRISYEGKNQVTGKWEEVETYGGKMTENIIQAIARDCLAVTMIREEDAGFPIVFHIHDETIIESDRPDALEEIEKIFSTPIPWAKDLPLTGAGYTTPFYLKD